MRYANRASGTAAAPSENAALRDTRAAATEPGAGAFAVSLASGASLATLAQLAIALASAILSVVVARLLGAAGTATFSVALSTLLILGAFTNVGIGHGVNYYVSRGRWRAGEALWQVQLAALVLGTVGALAGVVVAASGGGGIFRGAPVDVFVAVVVALPFWLSMTYSGSVALALGRYGIYAAGVVGQACATLLCVAGLGAAFGVLGATIGLVVAQAVAALGLIAWGTRALPVRGLRMGDCLSKLARAVKFGSKAYAANALQLLNLRADLFILNAVASKAAVGHYAVAISVMTLGLLLPTALATALLPRAAAFEAYATPGEQRALSIRAVRHAVVLSPFTAIALSFALLIAPVVYGGSFSPAVGLGFILLPGILAYGIGMVMSSNIVGKGYPAYVLYSAALVTPPTFALYLVLVPALHGAGAALASTLSYVAMTVVLFIFFRRATGITDLRQLVPDKTELADYRNLATTAISPVLKALHFPQTDGKA